MAFVIQRRGREERYVSGFRILKAPSNRDNGTKAANWTTRLTHAQRFSSQNEAENFVRTVFGPSGFRTLRLTEVSSDTANS
jgi:hypothetical protein